MSSHKRVQVCIRVRPPPDSAPPSSSNSVVVNGKEGTISVITNSANGSGTCFHFDQVLEPTTNQSGVYNAAASDIVDSVLSGYNGTIMAYGQTGAGKTFTMSGGKKQFEDRGICARAIAHIFHQITRDAEHSYVVRVSYVEVYNENLYDLLNFNEPQTNNSNNSNNNREDLVIQENEKGQTFVRGLSRPIVKTEEDAFDLLFQGETNRTIAEHCLNASSTRSHCIFTVYVERQATAEAGDLSSSVAVYSKLHLVDLAGSERMKKTHVSGVMLKEASHINKSLTFLEQVVIALGDKKRSHIPYRQTPLTNLLKDSLGGNCHTMLVACVWPEDSHNDQTLATLKFATRMMRVKTSAVVNVNVAAGGTGNGVTSAETQAMLQKYVAEIKRLKEELAMHDTLSGRSLVEYDLKSLQSPGARGKSRELIQRFIQSVDNPPPIQNLTQINLLLSVFREMYVEDRAQQQSHVVPVHPPAVPASVSASESRMVKQLRSLRTNSSINASATLPVITQWSASGRPSKSENLEPQADEDDNHDYTKTRLPPLRPFSPSTLSRPTTPLQKTEAQRHSSDKELFDAFKRLDDPKPESLLDLNVAKRNLQLAKAQASTLGLEINKLKLSIDGFTLRLQDSRTLSSVRGDRNDDSELTLVDRSTEFLVLQLKDAKKQYRETFEKFQEKKAEVKYLVKIKEQMLQKVTHEFQAWKTNSKENERNGPVPDDR